jgi:hypothetical protein
MPRSTVCSFARKALALSWLPQRGAVHRHKITIRFGADYFTYCHRGRLVILVGWLPRPGGQWFTLLGYYLSLAHTTPRRRRALQNHVAASGART